MNKPSNKLIGIAFALVVTIGSFLSVFGGSLKNLKIEQVEEIKIPVEIPKETVNVTPKPIPSIPIVSVPQPTISPTPSNTSPTTNPTPDTNSYTFSQVALHNSATSCWSTINGEVYNLTSWVNKHPGGKATILMICGKDGSPLFNAQHGGKNKIANILQNYDIGPLKS